MSSQKKGLSQKSKILIIVLACVLAILLAVAIFLIVSFSSSPDKKFEGLQGTIIGSQDELYEQPDGTQTLVDEQIAPQEITDNIVNVLLLGVDADYKPYAAGGGDRHTDAIMVVAINMTKNKVDLISIPRDTFTYVPGVKGMYKMNGAINTGGGVEKGDAGFEKTCESVSWLLGGINIDYYYALDFNAVKEIGDAIGGVDFNVDMNYQGQSGNVYKKGMQHLDGDGIMDYIRARKNATVNASDKGRVDRQKKMMVAIFKKLKESGKLSGIAKTIFAIKDGLYTNTTIDQTLSLANFAMNIEPEDIGQYSMSGALNMDPLGWAFCFTDQDNRVELIKNIYGIEVAKHTNTSYKYAKWLVSNDMVTTMKYINNADSTLDQMIRNAGGTGSMDDNEKADYEKLKKQLDKMQEAFNKAGSSMSSSDTKACRDLMSDLKATTESMITKHNCTKLNWSTVKADNMGWEKDTGVNEVTVDFS